MATLIRDHMKNEGVKFLNESVPIKVEKNKETGLLDVTWKDKSNQELKDNFETVLFAIGRQAQTHYLNLETAGVDIHPSSRKVLTSNEQTCVPHIYAIGDVLHEKPELTPVAIKAGRLLAHRLFGNSEEMMDYENISTTVFTPLEYGCVGLSEEKAIERYGDNNLEVYHAFYKPLEYSVSQEDSSQCYIKVICSKCHEENILGMHLLGPNAGEIMQGFGAAIKCGLTMKKLQQTVGIHPTVAEEIVKLNITKRSGIDPVVTGC